MENQQFPKMVFMDMLNIFKTKANIMGQSGLHMVSKKAVTFDAC